MDCQALQNHLTAAGILDAGDQLSPRLWALIRHTAQYCVDLGAPDEPTTLAFGDEAQSLFRLTRAAPARVAAESSAMDQEDMQERLVNAGVLEANDALAPNEWALMQRVAEYFASIGDRHAEDDRTYGDEVRSHFGLG